MPCRTIHKSKGLECDAATFRDDQLSRCLLYVAMSRAMKRLMFVLPQTDPTPLVII